MSRVPKSEILKMKQCLVNFLTVSIQVRHLGAKLSAKIIGSGKCMIMLFSSLFGVLNIANSFFTNQRAYNFRAKIILPR